MKKTLFFRVADRQPMGGSENQQHYDDYVWTAPDDSPYAPGYDANGKPRFFSLLKRSPDTVTPTAQKEDPVELLGTSGPPVDLLSGMLGEDHEVYEGRTITTVFSILWDMAKTGYAKKYLAKNRSWARQKGEINAKLNGRRWKINLDDDPAFYYQGRVRVTEALPDRTCDVTVEAQVEPWRYEMFSSMDVWLWRNFSFEEGIIRNREDYTLAIAAGGSKTLRVPPRMKREPVWIRSDKPGGAAVTVAVGDAEPEELTASDEFIPTHCVPVDGNDVLTVSNAGSEAVTIEIYYRGATL